MYHLGLIAKDIQNSVSPTVYKHLFASVGEEATYEIRNVPEDALAETVEYARNHWVGFNVTMPYKQAILPYMDRIDESARECGSTNTVLVKDGKLIAYNTDGWGCIRALEKEGFDWAGKKVVMLGAGGVAFSIAYNMSIHGVERVEVVNLIPEQTERLCRKFGDRFRAHPLDYEVLNRVCRDADLFLNASVMGQIGYDGFASFAFLDELKSDAFVFDVNYSNPDSKLVPTAREKGHRAFIGSRMTAWQAARVMEIWADKVPADAAMEELLEMLTKGVRL